MQVASRALAADKFQKHSVTERMFEELARHNRNDPQATGAGGATTLEDLKKMDKIWHAIRNNPPAKPPQVVSTSGAPLTAPPQYDVIVCGGTLGIFLATALQRCGARVAVLERGKLQGRAQEWNVSRGEMARLVELGVLSQQQLEGVIGLEFNPVRIGFQVRHSKQYLQLACKYKHRQGFAMCRVVLSVSPARTRAGQCLGSVACWQRACAGMAFLAVDVKLAVEHGVDAVQGGEDIWTKDVLNLGVKPDKMVDVAAQRFTEAGGSVLDQTAASDFTVHPDGVAITVGQDSKPLTGRLLIDCMGHSSPIVRQLRCNSPRSMASH